MRSFSLVILLLSTTLKYASAAPQVTQPDASILASAPMEATLEASFNVNLASTGQIVQMNGLGFGACSGLQGASNAGIDIGQSLRNFNSSAPSSTFNSIRDAPTSSSMIEASMTTMADMSSTMAALPTNLVSVNVMSSTMIMNSASSTIAIDSPVNTDAIVVPSSSADSTVSIAAATVTVTVDSCQAPSGTGVASFPSTTAFDPIQTDAAIIVDAGNSNNNNTMPIFTMDDMMPSSTMFITETSTAVVDPVASSTALTMPEASGINATPTESVVDTSLPSASASASVSESMTVALPTITGEPIITPSESMSTDPLATPTNIVNNSNPDINPGGGMTQTPTVGVTPMTNTDTLAGFLDTVVLKIGGETVCTGSKDAIVTNRGYKCNCSKKGHSLYMIKDDYFRLKRKANFKTFCKNKYTFIYNDGIKDHRIVLEGPKQNWKQSSKKCNVKFAKKFTCNK